MWGVHKPASQQASKPASSQRQPHSRSSRPHSYYYYQTSRSLLRSSMTNNRLERNKNKPCTDISANDISSQDLLSLDIVPLSHDIMSHKTWPLFTWHIVTWHFITWPVVTPWLHAAKHFRMQCRIQQFNGQCLDAKQFSTLIMFIGFTFCFFKRDIHSLFLFSFIVIKQHFYIKTCR